MSRDVFAREALAQIPKILTLQDRNAHSPTYGCFDRNYWHYKIIDFPSGMAQEFVWPLALVYSLDLPDNPYRGKPAIREWVEAGMLFAARSAHADGSCDDYFPFEKAAGAAAFSLLACLESYQLLQIDNAELRAFFAKRADWLASHEESGRLTNHQALTALCLTKLGKEEASARRLQRVLEWQDEEGWFAEYEGCDPGYHTLTIALLAQLYELRPDRGVASALRKAIEFAAHFIHPDGSFGGEYGSRNTYNFFPHGFEIAGKWMPEALALNDRFLAGLTNGLQACYADDHIIGHHTWSYLLAWQHWVAQRPQPSARPAGRTHFARAGLLVERRGSATLYLALNKGGVFKLFHGEQLALSDTQVSVLMDDGRNAVAQLVGVYDVQLREDEIVISGSLGWAKQKKMTPPNMIVLRLLMLTIGRFFPDLVRKLLQRMLITGKEHTPFRFKRTLTWQGEELHIADELTADSWTNVRAVGIGPAQTSIYVVMSRTWQAGQLQSWLDLTSELQKLKPSDALRFERRG
ncbi:MAG TPA: hypothetical protein VG095_03535 [Chthoniobacterales bacterium]|nr:hypothetical protein [Chthoniobacterales bacterium]